MAADSLAGRPVIAQPEGGGWLRWYGGGWNPVYWHAIDPLLFELGWRAWSYLYDEWTFGPDLVDLA